MTDEITKCEILKGIIGPPPGETGEYYLSDGVSVINLHNLLTEDELFLVWEGNYG
ncbi:MAG: hypothetical protein JXR36_13465 [Bacteroidales bacterium]|nr:hypothetical protein [Bacteroidales bacterium]